jgi:hypothetical protein
MNAGDITQNMSSVLFVREDLDFRMSNQRMHHREQRPQRMVKWIKQQEVSSIHLFILSTIILACQQILCDTVDLFTGNEYTSGCFHQNEMVSDGGWNWWINNKAEKLFNSSHKLRIN